MSNEHLSASTKIMACSCKHEYQDQIHGKGMRVHNPASKKPVGITWRCTVCGGLK